MLQERDQRRRVEWLLHRHNAAETMKDIYRGSHDEVTPGDALKLMEDINHRVDQLASRCVWASQPRHSAITFHNRGPDVFQHIAAQMRIVLTREVLPLSRAVVVLRQAIQGILNGILSEYVQSWGGNQNLVAIYDDIKRTGAFFSLPQYHWSVFSSPLPHHSLSTRVRTMACVDLCRSYRGR